MRVKIAATQRDAKPHLPCAREARKPVEGRVSTLSRARWEPRSWYENRRRCVPGASRSGIPPPDAGGFGRHGGDGSTPPGQGPWVRLRVARARGVGVASGCVALGPGAVRFGPLRCASVRRQDSPRFPGEARRGMPLPAAPGTRRGTRTHAEAREAWGGRCAEHARHGSSGRRGLTGANFTYCPAMIVTLYHRGAEGEVASCVTAVGQAMHPGRVSEHEGRSTSPRPASGPGVGGWRGRRGSGAIWHSRARVGGPAASVRTRPGAVARDRP